MHIKTILILILTIFVRNSSESKIFEQTERVVISNTKCQVIDSFKILDEPPEPNSYGETCAAAVKIGFNTSVTTKDTVTITPTYGYLMKNGQVTDSDKAASLPADCRRTKIYAFNETHVLLRFGKLNYVFNITTLQNSIGKLLYDHDKVYYIANMIDVYDEILGKWNVRNLVQVLLKFLLNYFY
jgi:hypothetical protein